MSEPVNLIDSLMTDDDGVDSTVSASEIDEFKISSQEAVITFLLPKHRKVKLAKFKNPNNGFTYRVWKTPEIEAWMENEGRSYLQEEDRWFNVVYVYNVNRVKKPVEVVTPVSGSVQFFSFPKNKYIDLRDIMEGDQGLTLENLQLKVALDGEEKFQKMKFSKNGKPGKTHLRMAAGVEIVSAFQNGDKNFIRDNEITEEVVNAIKSFQALPSSLDKHSPMMREVQAAAEALVEKVKRYSKFAKMKTVAQLKAEAEGSKEVGKQLAAVEQNTSSVGDMEKLLG